MSAVTPQRKLPWWLIATLIVLSPLIAAVVVVGLPAIICVLLVVFALYLITSVCLHLLVWLLWCLRGRDILFVYSDSPVWQQYVEQRLLPPIRDRAFVLNWSQRKRWRFSLARLVFQHFGGYREFNPLAVVFRPFRRTRTFRFWQPFRDFKHGKTATLYRMEKEFFSFIGVPHAEPAP